MSWGLILNTNTRCTQIIEHSFHLTRATLFEDGFAGAAYVKVIVQYQNNPHHCLCHLSPPNLNQIPLDLKFKKNAIISFTTVGDSPVHLMGSLIMDDEEWKEKEYEELLYDSPRRLSNCTVVSGDHLEGKWLINDFLAVLPKKGKALCSETFFNDTREIRWNLKLCRIDQRGEDKECASLHLWFDTRGSERVKKHKVTAYCSLSFDHGKRVGSMICLDEEITEYEFDHGITQFSSWTSWHQDSLTIYFNVYIFIESPLLRETLEKELLFDVKQRQLTYDFRQLCKEPKEFSDVVLIVGEEKFPAHKIILATRSPVFAVMFQRKEMIENRKNEVEIEGMEPIVVKAMLEFIYTDAVENLGILAPELLEAADKYELRRLRALCERSICESLGTDNAAEYLILSDRHHSYPLKQLIIEFIKNHRRDVKKSEGYEQMEKNYPALVKELNRSFDSNPKCESGTTVKRETNV